MLQFRSQTLPSTVGPRCNSALPRDGRHTQEHDRPSIPRRLPHPRTRERRERVRPLHSHALPYVILITAAFLQHWNSYEVVICLAVSNEPIDYDEDNGEDAPSLTVPETEGAHSREPSGSDDECGGVSLHSDKNCTTSNNSPDVSKKPQKKRKISVKRFQLNACKQS